MMMMRDARNGKVCQVLGSYLGEREREREREREERAPYKQWMEEIRKQLYEKVSQVNNFNITFEKVKKEVAKRKRWTAPSIDGIQNYW